MAEASAHIRARFWKDGAFMDDAHVTLDIRDRFGADALKRMLVILGRVPQDPLAIAAFTRSRHARRLVDVRRRPRAGATGLFRRVRRVPAPSRILAAHNARSRTAVLAPVLRASTATRASCSRSCRD